MRLRGEYRGAVRGRAAGSRRLCLNALDKGLLFGLTLRILGCLDLGRVHLGLLAGRRLFDRGLAEGDARGVAQLLIVGSTQVPG